MKPELRLKTSALLLSLCCLMPLAARSQSVSFESVKISEMLVNAGWSQMEAVLPVIFSELEKNIKSAGATDNASKIFVGEMQKVMNREGVSRVYAQLVAAKLTVEEQRDVLAFFNSSAGQKYLALSRQAGSDEVMAPLVKQACTATNPQLGFFDRGSLNKLCRNP